MRATIALGIFLSTAPDAWAAVRITNVGPITLRRARPEGLFHTTVFPARIGSGTLVIANHGATRVRVRLNSADVSIPTTPQNVPAEIRVEVQLAESNRLEIAFRPSRQSSLTLYVTQELDVDAAAIIGTEGGTISITDPQSSVAGISLDVPPGVFTAPTLLTVAAAATDVDTPPHLDALTTSISLEPHGTAFTAPVTLRWTLPAAIVPPHRQILLAFRNDTGDGWQYVSSAFDTASGQLTASLSHFSTYRILYGRYPAGEVTWRIASLPSNVSHYTATEVRTAVRRAFELWQAELQTTGVHFVETTLDADIVVNWSNLNYANTIGYFAHLACVTEWWNVGGRIRIGCYDALTFDGGRLIGQWVAPRDPGPFPPGHPFEVDVQDTITHELGHALGLSHISAQAPPMMGSASNGDGSLHTLFRPDRQALASLYGIVPESLSGYGTALIDGEFSFNEWLGAARYKYQVNLPHGGSAPATLFVMNDRTHLYLGTRIDAPNLLSSDAYFEFDRWDIVGGGAYSWMEGQSSFVDAVRLPNGFAPADTDLGGRLDGAGGSVVNATRAIVELSHPLDSGDRYDFELGPGSQTQMSVFVRLFSPANVYADTLRFDLPPVQIR